MVPRAVQSVETALPSLPLLPRANSSELGERHPQVVRHGGEELQRLAVHGQSGDGHRLLRQQSLADDRHQLALGEGGADGLEVREARFVQ